MPIDQHQLTGHWVHSYEDDEAGTLVFRPSDYDFPPARGRNAYDLRPDGSYVAAGIGPTDAPQHSRGKWKLEEGRLALYPDSPGPPGELLQVVSVAPDRLVVRR
jgi:hypothetical protein